MQHIGGIVGDLVEAVNQAALQSVNQTGPGAVVAAHAQNKALVLGKGQLIKESGIKVFGSILGLGTHLEGLLRQIKTVLALQAELAVLVKDGLTILAVVLHMAGAGILAYATVVGVCSIREFIRDRALVQLAAGAGAHGEHTILLVPQLVRISNKADNRECVVEVQQICGGRRFAGL